LITQIKTSFLPPLTKAAHKGQAGRVVVVGGSLEYTGAPYFAAISSLKTGADMSYVICSHSAATPLKCYDPDLIVLPLLRTAKEQLHHAAAEQSDETLAAEGLSWIERAHAVVIGPGLGRDVAMQNGAARLIAGAKSRNLPIIFDGDGLWAVENNTDLVKDYPRAILTPNVNEFSRLCKKILDREPGKTPSEDLLKELSVKLGHVVIVQKGERDLISNGRQVLVCDEEGGLRRCGGLGDLLAGSIGAFASWATRPDLEAKDSESNIDSLLLAAFGACFLMKRCSRAAFKEKGRSMLAADVVKVIGSQFRSLFDT